MEEVLQLLSSYSFSEIVCFIIALLLAIKGLITFLDWTKEKITLLYKKHYKQDIAKINQKTKEEEKNEIINQIKTEQAEIRNCITELTNKTNLLLESDKDDIKSFITKEHHYFCYKQKWIDDYSLDCCEKRYAHYKAEKGNSFIEGFMEELRALPKEPNIRK